MPLTAAAPVADSYGQWYAPGTDGCIYSWTVQGGAVSGVPSGSLRWKKCLRTKYPTAGYNANFTGVAVGSSAVFTLSSDGNLYALSTVDGTVYDVYRPPYTASVINATQQGSYSNHDSSPYYIDAIHDHLSVLADSFGNGNDIVVFRGLDRTVYAIKTHCVASTTAVQSAVVSCTFQRTFLLDAVPSLHFVVQMVIMFSLFRIVFIFTFSYYNLMFSLFLRNVSLYFSEFFM